MVIARRFPQPCVFGVGYHNDIGLPDQFWPFGSQVGWYDTNPATGEAAMYFRTNDAHPLQPYSAYVVKYVCPPKTTNPAQGNN